ncbi:MAG: hypothetical protein V2L15_04550 [Desulfobacteraceae bacterium]|jgi:hypothetical protein|nr:hypothetical protein [Desulfobacteraceae bacterium]
MNFIDAIEGTGRSILESLHRGYLDGSRDDSEFIGNVKMVIEGIDAFISAHAELMIPADVVVKVLYNHARQLWLEGGEAEEAEKKDGGQDSAEENETAAYRRYYFDYVYQHGVYPR